MIVAFQIVAQMPRKLVACMLRTLPDGKGMLKVLLCSWIPRGVQDVHRSPVLIVPDLVGKPRVPSYSMLSGCILGPCPWVVTSSIMESAKSGQQVTPMSIQFMSPSKFVIFPIFPWHLSPSPVVVQFGTRMRWTFRSSAADGRIRDGQSHA